MKKILIGHEKKIRLSLLILLAIGIFVGSIYRSYHFPVVREVTIDSPKLFRAEQPLRYLLISDLHENEFGKDNVQLYEKIRNLHPDFILVVGDVIDWTADDHAYAVRVIRKLADIANVYFTLGNHEIEYMLFRGEVEITGNDRMTASYNLPETDKRGLVSDLRSAGAIVLQREWRDITVHGIRVRIGAAYEGMYSLDENKPYETLLQGMKSFLTEFQATNCLKLYMTHRPSSFLMGNAPDLWNIDVVMSGHEHGGQVIFPFIGGVYSRERGFFPGRTKGNYQIGDTTFIVTSGLGSDRELFPRFNNPPEMVLVTVQ